MDRAKDARWAPAQIAIVAAIRARRRQHHRPLVVAIDGGSGAGKSTLAKSIAEGVDAAVIHCDDFFCNDLTLAEWDALSPSERASRAIDWRRLRAQAIEPLLAGREASWHPFNFAAGPGTGLSSDVATRQPAPVVILDGIYSARPELADLVGLSVLVEVPAEVRQRRHDEREARNQSPEEPESQWHERWDSAEAYYFAEVRPPSSFDLVVRPAAET